MKSGDLVRIRKSAIESFSTLWFIELADNKTPLLLVEKINGPVYPMWSVYKPDGSTFFIQEEKLTKRMW
tara:strand:+ start:153 stop:359 length:207 start_codon:yes stop_codon:yes gene_type:complete